MTPPHHVDSTQHPRGEYALLDELRLVVAQRDRLAALLREGLWLVEAVTCFVVPGPDTLSRADAWREAVRKEVGQ